MSREHPFKCPHGNYLGGHESFGYEDARCAECESERVAIPPPGTQVDQLIYNQACHRIMELEDQLRDAPVKMWLFVGWGVLCFNLGIALGAWLF